jgi:hypothetical protein
MKSLKVWWIFICVLFFTCIMLLLGLITGCNSTKKINTSKQTYDSTAISVLKDSVRTFKKEVQTLKQTLSEKETVDVVFDNTLCPPCPKLPTIPNNLDLLNKDSINVLIHDLNDLIQFQNNYMAGQDNKIKRLADGSVEYSGRLKSYKQTDEKKQEIINSLIRESDSLRDLLQQNSTTIAKVAEIKSIDKKVVAFPWYFWLITGGFALLWLNKQFKIIG